MYRVKDRDPLLRCCPRLRAERKVAFLSPVAGPFAAPIQTDSKKILTAAAVVVEGVVVDDGDGAGSEPSNQ